MAVGNVRGLTPPPKTDCDRLMPEAVAAFVPPARTDRGKLLILPKKQKRGT